MPLELPKKYRDKIFPTHVIEREVKIINGGFWDPDAPGIKIGVLEVGHPKAANPFVRYWNKLKRWWRYCLAQLKN